MDFPKISKNIPIIKEKKISKAHPAPSGSAGASIKNFFAGSSSGAQDPGSVNSAAGPSSVASALNSAQPAAGPGSSGLILSDSGAETAVEVESGIGEIAPSVEMTGEGDHAADDESSKKSKNSDVLEEPGRVDLEIAGVSDPIE